MPGAARRAVVPGEGLWLRLGCHREYPKLTKEEYMFTITDQDILDAAKALAVGPSDVDKMTEATPSYQLINGVSGLPTLRSMATGTMLAGLITGEPAQSIANGLALALTLGFQAGLDRAVKHPDRAYIEANTPDGPTYRA